MPDENDDLAEAADKLAVFEEEVEGAIIPVASNSYVGAGIYDPDAAMSRLAEPLDLQSIAPQSSWQELPRVLGEIYDQISLTDVVASGLRGDEWRTIFTNPVVYATEAASAYSNYIEIQFYDYISLIETIGRLQQQAISCSCNLLALSLEAIADVVLSDDQTALDQAKQDLLITVATNPDCEPLLELIEALEDVAEAIAWFKSMKNNLNLLWEEVGGLGLMLAEILRDAEIQDAIDKIRQDPLKLGQVHGTLVGFVVWQVIETVFTAGLGKGVKAIKVIL